MERKENRRDTGSTEQEDDNEEVSGQKKGHEKCEKSTSKSSFLWIQQNIEAKEEILRYQ